jgi:hypothetical protein
MMCRTFAWIAIILGLPMLNMKLRGKKKQKLFAQNVIAPITLSLLKRRKQMLKRFRVYYIDEVEAETEEGAYDQTLEYLRDCVNYGDVSLFNYEYIGNVEEKEDA